MLKRYDDFKKQNEGMKQFSKISKDSKKISSDEKGKAPNPKFLDYEEEINSNILAKDSPIKDVVDDETNIVGAKIPSFIKSMRIQEKVSNAGFDWANRKDVKNKILEELNELENELESGNSENIESELGDLIFSVINYGRFIGVNPDNALENTNKRFIKRFLYVESQLKNDSKNFSDISIKEMKNYWEKSKK